MQGFNPAGVRFWKLTRRLYLLLFLFSCKRQRRKLYETLHHDKNSETMALRRLSIAALWQLLKRALAP